MVLEAGRLGAVAGEQVELVEVSTPEIDDVLASIRDDKRLTAIRAALAAAKRDIARANEQTKTETALDDQQKELEEVRKEAQAVAAERKTREEDLEKRVERRFGFRLLVRPGDVALGRG